MVNNFQISGVAAVLNKDDISTDIIVPASFMVTTSRSGLAKGLFYNWRYDKDDKPNNNFVLNKQKFANASILIAGDNFGCGSSREHAVWALVESGIKVIIATSFAEIFATNAAKNKLATISLTGDEIDEICSTEQRGGIIELDIDLKFGILTDKPKKKYNFKLTKEQYTGLIEGIDDIEIAVCKMDVITKYTREFL